MSNVIILSGYLPKWPMFPYLPMIRCMYIKNNESNRDTSIQTVMLKTVIQLSMHTSS